MPFYIRTPSRMEARQWTGLNTNELIEWSAGRVYYDPHGHNLKVEKEGGAIKLLNLGDYVIKLPNRTFDGMAKNLFEADYRLETLEEGPSAFDPTHTVATLEEAAPSVDEVIRENQIDKELVEKKAQDDGIGAYTMKNGPFS